MTDAFVDTARAMAQAWGLPDYRFVTLTHPIANLTDDELDQRAHDVVPEVVKLLVQE